jgi:hypothetical protein
MKPKERSGTKLWRSTDQGWVIKKNIQNFEHPTEHHYIYYKKNERIWHHKKPAKRGPPTKSHGPGKEVINQRDSKETKYLYFLFDLYLTR